MYGPCAILVNKILMKDLGFHYPVMVSTLGQATTAICAALSVHLFKWTELNNGPKGASSVLSPAAESRRVFGFRCHCTFKFHCVPPTCSALEHVHLTRCSNGSRYGAWPDSLSLPHYRFHPNAQGFQSRVYGRGVRSCTRTNPHTSRARPIFCTHPFLSSSEYPAPRTA